MYYALAANAVGAGEMREFNIRTAEITDHVFVFLPRATALHHDVVARFVIAAVVADYRDDGHVVARHCPKRITLSEEKPAVALKRDDLFVRHRELDSDRGAHAPAKRTTQRAPNFHFLAIGERERTQEPIFRPDFFDND